MFLEPSSKKIVTLALIVTVCAGILLPIRTARAQLAVKDPFNLIFNSLQSAATAVVQKLTSDTVLKEYVLDPLAYIVAQTLIRTMTNEILGWIQGKDSGFVQNLEDEFLRAADAEAGALVNSLLPIIMCGNIGAFLQLSLRAPVSLKQRLECTLTDIVESVENFYQDFEQGGWPAFIGINLRPQNNPYGAYLIALDAQIEAQTKAQRSREINLAQGKGFLGFRVPREADCEFISTAAAAEIQQFLPLDTIKGGQKIKKVTDDLETGGAYQLCDIKYDTATPGSVFADSLSNVITSDQRRGELADELNEGIQAIVYAFLSEVIKATTGGSSGLFGGGSGDTYRPPLGPISEKIAPGTVFTPSSITSQTDDAAFRLQEMQKILDGKIAALDTAIIQLNKDIAALEVSCDSIHDEIDCDQRRIDQLKTEKSAKQTEKSPFMGQLGQANAYLNNILSIRSQFLTSTDPVVLQGLNLQLSSLLTAIETLIQQIEGGVASTIVTADQISNFIQVIDNSVGRTPGVMTLLDAKIAAEKDETKKEQMELAKGNIIRVSRELESLRTRLLATASSGGTSETNPLMSEATPKITGLDAGFFSAYSF